MDHQAGTSRRSLLKACLAAPWQAGGLEAKSKARQITGSACVTIGGLADEWVSYVLPAEEYRRGGYEASMSFYGEKLGSTLVEGIIRGARGLN